MSDHSLPEPLPTAERGKLMKATTPSLTALSRTCTNTLQIPAPHLYSEQYKSTTRLPVWGDLKYYSHQ